MPQPAVTPITAHAITLSARPRVSPDVLLQETGDEAVLLDIAGEHYFGLNAVGTRVWRLLEAGADLRAVCDVLLGQYDVGAEVLEHDVIALVGQLADAGLVAIE